MPADTTRDQLAKSLVRALKALRNVRPEDKAKRTELFRHVADCTFSLREFFLVDGEPDWSGRSWAYREFLRERYTEAGYSREESQAVQPTIRYHVSVLVRQRLEPEQVRNLGLRTEDVLGRQKEQREARKALLDVARGGGANPDPGRTVAAANLMLQPLDAGTIRSLSEEERGQVRTLLARLARQVAELSAAADAG
ncbi:hypothetical protein [Micromonospora sp. WMMD980]|uniref:hypothetical protein n=1 Tax=Micromonospora sp. WMMD980 TaxID=3016088 RepID=UPI00241687CE|nr:hypothetical protein [Micromonospora sp. WMMD980]MDG4801736.1 hypothetical protein [Micromonospora sp. WMMD980]